MAEENKAIEWPGGANVADDFDFLMVGKDGEPIMKIPKEKLNEVIVINGEGIKAVAGGASSATPTILAPGPAGQNRKMEDVTGWFVNGTGNPLVAVGEPWEAPTGFKNTNWWDGVAGTWSLGSSVALPTVDTSDLLKNEELGYREQYLDFTANRKVDTALTSGGAEITGSGYIIASRIPVKSSSKYEIDNVVPVTNAKFLVFLASNGNVISSVPMSSAKISFDTTSITASISFTIKAPSESTETTPTLKWIDESEIIKIKDSNVVDVKAQATLEKLPLNQQFTKGFILLNTALTSVGNNAAGTGYAIINKMPIQGDTDYVIGGVRPSVNGNKFFSQYNSLGVHIATVELKELPKVIKTTTNTRFISYTIETPPETDGYGTKNNYFGKIESFLSDAVITFWRDKIIVTFGDSITWYDRKTFGTTHLEAGQIVVGYQSHMRNKLGCVIDNQGESGYDMTQIYQVKVLPFDFSKVDAATFTSGANDSRKGIPVGQVAPIGSAFNTSTFCGALQASIERAYAGNPKIKIFLFTPINGKFKESGTSNVPGPTGGVMNVNVIYVNAIKDIGKLYGVPVGDWYNDSQINLINIDQYIGDKPDQPYKLHPLNAGYVQMGTIAVNLFINNSL